MRMQTIICVVLLLFIFNQPVYADTSHRLPNIRDRLTEKIIGLFKFSATDKANYQEEIVANRFQDIKNIMSTNRGDMLEEVSSRYVTNVNKLDELYRKNRSSIDKKKLLTELQRQEEELLVIRKDLKYESGLWIMLQHSINTAHSFSNELQKS